MDLITLNLSWSKAESKSGPVVYPVQCFQSLPKRQIGIQIIWITISSVKMIFSLSLTMDLLKSTAFLNSHHLHPFVLLPYPSNNLQKTTNPVKCLARIKLKMVHGSPACVFNVTCSDICCFHDAHLAVSCQGTNETWETLGVE